MSSILVTHSQPNLTDRLGTAGLTGGTGLGIRPYPMKTIRTVAAALLAASVFTVSAVAADISGNWKWTTQGRNGPIEVTAKLALTDGALTGTVSGRMGDTAIGDASFADGHVAFTVTREFDGNKFVVKYDGKFEGDTIIGTIVRPDRDTGAPMTLEWKAARVN